MFFSRLPGFSLEVAMDPGLGSVTAMGPITFLLSGLFAIAVHSAALLVAAILRTTASITYVVKSTTCFWVV